MINPIKFVIYNPINPDNPIKKLKDNYVFFQRNRNKMAETLGN